ncbi:MAG TPA: hypothetical protein VM513_25705 [Kofleriaceae bacterium]|jgi:hypothetical protein|nr:hypothetical protein [Kofleriaceae bacterium]
MRTLLFLALLTGACSAYDTDLGPTPYLCGQTDPVCPEGYACQEDTTTGDRICVGGDGLMADFDCADDSDVEPNDLLGDATSTGLDGTNTFRREDLAICAAGDRDVFAITIATQGEAIELVTEFQANGAPLVASILNAGGIPIATATAVTGERTELRAIARDLAPGQYYAQVAAEPGARLMLNNYTLSLAVTGP